MRNKKNVEELSATILLQKIRSEEINPKTLSPEERQACESLVIIGEGFTHAQAAQLLHCSEKTIQRDVAEIRRQNSLSPSLELARQLIGEMVIKAENHIAHLMRLSRGRDGSIGERAQSEFLAWKVRVDFMCRLQSLGYLPLVTQRFEGDLFHHFDDEDSEKSLEEARKTLDEVVKIASQCGNLTPGLEKDVSMIKKKIEEVEIVHDSNKLLKEQNNKNAEEKNDTKN